MNYTFIKSSDKDSQSFVYTKVLISKIFYIEGFGDYTKLYTDIDRFVIHGGTTKIITYYPFLIQVHRSFAINPDNINSIQSGNISIKGIKIPIGRTYKDNLFTALKINY